MSSSVQPFTVPLVCVGLLFISVLRAEAKPQPEAQDQSNSKPVPLNKKKTVLLDKEGNRLLLKTKVVLRQGLLEMLLCKKQTKEHESILAIDSKAYVIHTGLLALGLEPGKPVRFSPDYQPPTGPRLKVILNWTDQQGRPHRAAGQRWVRHVTRRYYAEPLKERPDDWMPPEDSELRYDKKNGELVWYGIMKPKQRDALLKLSQSPKYRNAIRSFYKRSQPQQMEAEWVFVGSNFYVNEKTGERFYRAEGGDVICVANFPSALLDVAIPSTSKGTSNLLFEAYTPRIPPLGTKVTIELIPASGQPKDEQSPREP